MLFSVAFGICPPQPSLRLRGARLHPALPQGRPARERAWSPHPRRLRRTVPPFPACAVQAGTLRLRVPSTPSHPRSRGLLPCLAAAHRPTGFASPGSSRVADLPTVFQVGSSMGTLPSEVSPHPSPPDPLGPSCPPCRFPPCGAAAPRMSASGGCVLQSRRCSRPQWVAPLLVVSPLRG